jgi:hypothetical protein
MDTRDSAPPSAVLGDQSNVAKNNYYTAIKTKKK